MSKIKMPTTDEVAGMWQASGLKEKLLFTFAMIAIFRFGVQIPIFGIDNAELLTSGKMGDLVGFLDIFTGGALGKVSIFALGIGPYITASIIMQLLAAAVPALEKLQKEEGEAGRRKLSQYTRYFTVILSVFQSTVFLTYLSKMGMLSPDGIPALNFIGSILTLTAGTMFIMWLAELITENGIGNGASILIFIGIISRIPSYFGATGQLVGGNTGMAFGLVLLIAIFLATLVLIVIMQEAMRKVVIVNARRQVGNKVYGGVNTHIPFKLNPGGVMPIIFAVAILLFPTTILSLLSKGNMPETLKNIIDFISNDLLSGYSYYIIYFLLIVGLTFFYASIMPNMQPKEIANNLKKYGSSIPGIKPGKPTADALDKILSRVTFIGALGLGIIALVPGIATQATHITPLQGLGSTSLIIMVGVALDFINQIKTHLLARQYEGFLKQ
ncbi:MAG: preprotein translocase subunit SecY [Candidatus Melainabacteria bacterium GWA2_34_9]|nr:MAG: preprotein translocase subunit SecY [Candidatus Melainabacteria bacterium GWA2_34_9]